MSLMGVWKKKNFTVYGTKDSLRELAKALLYSVETGIPVSYGVGLHFIPCESNYEADILSGLEANTK